jgi:hypothetical protein
VHDRVALSFFFHFVRYCRSGCVLSGYPHSVDNFRVQSALPTEGPTNGALPTKPFGAAPHGIEKILPSRRIAQWRRKAHSGCQESVRERELTRLRLATERTTTRDTAPGTPPARSILDLTGCWRCDLLVRVSKEHRFTSCSKNLERETLWPWETVCRLQQGP